MIDYIQSLLKPRDYALASNILGGMREPDLVISPDGDPYLVRWHVRPRGMNGNVYLHIQVADDQDRMLHDHPWDNTSIILAGGYWEDTFVRNDPVSLAEGHRAVRTIGRYSGDTIHREARDAHRLALPVGVDYAMTLFITGPWLRDWGFWLPRGWVSHKEIVTTAEGESRMTT